MGEKSVVGLGSTEALVSREVHVPILKIGVGVGGGAGIYRL